MGVNIIARILGLDENPEPSIEKEDRESRPPRKRVTEKWGAPHFNDKEETRGEDEPE